jgi:hypothetical protein
MLVMQHAIFESLLFGNDSLINDFNKRSDSMYQRPSYFDNNIDEWKGYGI